MICRGGSGLCYSRPAGTTLRVHQLIQRLSNKSNRQFHQFLDANCLAIPPRSVENFQGHQNSTGGHRVGACLLTSGSLTWAAGARRPVAQDARRGPITGDQPQHGAQTLPRAGDRRTGRRPPGNGHVRDPHPGRGFAGLPRGRIAALVGPNGTGKSTCSTWLSGCSDPAPARGSQENNRS